MSINLNAKLNLKAADEPLQVLHGVLSEQGVSLVRHARPFLIEAAPHQPQAPAAQLPLQLPLQLSVSL